MRLAFSNLREQVKQKFIENDLAQNTAISGFLFLRFFAPAVLGPGLFGLCDDKIDQKASRTLTLVAKVLQNMANFVKFGQKEAFMIPLNTFLEAKFELMHKFLHKISTASEESDDTEITVEATLEVDLAKQMSRIHQYLNRHKDKLKESSEDELLNYLYDEVERLDKYAELVAKELADSGLKKRISAKSSDRKSTLSTSQNTFLRTNSSQSISSSSSRGRDRSRTFHGSSSFSIPKPDLRTLNPSKSVEKQLSFLQKGNSEQMKRTGSGISFQIKKEEVERFKKEEVGRKKSFTSDNVFNEVQLEDEIAKIFCKTKETIEMVSEKKEQPIVLQQKPRCSLCNKDLMGNEQHKINNQFFCTTHYELAVANGFCSKCNLVIVGEYLQVKDCRFHPNHFQCDLCGVALTTQYYEMNQKYYCKIDYLRAVQLTCRKCSHIIDGKYFESAGNRFHQHCFVCDICDGSLNGKTVSFTNDKVVCCHRESDNYLCQPKAKELICKDCRAPIAGKYIIALGMHYHADHFRCFACNSGLFDVIANNTLPFYEIDNYPFCEMCYARKKSTPNVSLDSVPPIKS